MQGVKVTIFSIPYGKKKDEKRKKKKKMEEERK